MFTKYIKVATIQPLHIVTRCCRHKPHKFGKCIKFNAFCRQISHTYANFGYVYCRRLVLSVPVHCIQYATKNRFCQTNKTTVNSFSFCHYKQTEARISTASTLQTQPTAQTIGNKKKTVAKATCPCNSLIVIQLMPFPLFCFLSASTP